MKKGRSATVARKTQVSCGIPTGAVVVLRIKMTVGGVESIGRCVHILSLFIPFQPDTRTRKFDSIGSTCPERAVSGQVFPHCWQHPIPSGGYIGVDCMNRFGLAIQGNQFSLRSISYFQRHFGDKLFCRACCNLGRGQTLWDRLELESRM